MGSTLSRKQKKTDSPPSSRCQFTLPFDIPVKLQMEFIITHWLRNYGQMFPMDITHLIVETYLYQPIFAVDHEYRLKHSDEFIEEFCGFYTKREQPMHFDYLIKILVVGSVAVGKSSLVLRYIKNTFNEYQECTIGAAFLSKTITVNGIKLRLQLWEPAGGAHYRSVEHLYYRDTIGFIMVYDVTNRDTFQEVALHDKKCSNYTSELQNRILIGNKIDDEQKRVVSTEEGQQMAIDLGVVDYVETSARTGENVDEAIHTLALRILHRIERAKTPWIG